MSITSIRTAFLVLLWCTPIFSQSDDLFSRYEATYKAANLSFCEGRYDTAASQAKKAMGLLTEIYPSKTNDIVSVDTTLPLEEQRLIMFMLDDDATVLETPINDYFTQDAHRIKKMKRELGLDGSPITSPSTTVAWEKTKYIDFMSHQVPLQFLIARINHTIGQFEEAMDYYYRSLVGALFVSMQSKFSDFNLYMSSGMPGQSKEVKTFKAAVRHFMNSKYNQMLCIKLVSVNSIVEISLDANSPSTLVTKGKNILKNLALYNLCYGEINLSKILEDISKDIPNSDKKLTEVRALRLQIESRKNALKQKQDIKRLEYLSAEARTVGWKVKKMDNKQENEIAKSLLPSKDKSLLYFFGKGPRVHVSVNNNYIGTVEKSRFIFSYVAPCNNLVTTNARRRKDVHRDTHNLNISLSPGAIFYFEVGKKGPIEISEQQGQKYLQENKYKISDVLISHDASNDFGGNSKIE